MGSARDIYQQVLNQMTNALMARDTQTYCDAVRLPLVSKAIDGSMTHKDFDSLKASLLSYRDTLEAHGIEDYVRICDTAKFVTATRISGHHTTRALAGGRDVATPFLTRMNLHLIGDVWKVSETDNALRSSDWPMMPTEEFDAPVKPSSEDQARLRIFQNFLDRISAAFTGGDVEGWLNSVALPFQMISRDGVKSFQSRQEVIEDFDAYQVEFKTHGLTDIIRQAKTAILIGGDQMTGTYRTHIMRGSAHLVPPWDASMTLRFENGGWRITTVMSAIGHHNWTAITPSDIEKTPKTTPEKGAPE